MKLSIASSLYVNYPFEEAIERISKFGYEGIDLSALSEYGAARPRQLDKKRRMGIRELAFSSGLEIAAYDPELLPASGYCLSHRSEKIREDTINYIKESVDLTADIGAKVVVVVPGRAIYGVPFEDAWNWSVDAFKNCAEYAETRGVVLGLEHLTPLEGNIVCTLNDVTKMLRDVNSKSFGFVLDTGHVNVMKESLTDYAKLLRKDIVHIHWDNNDGLADSHDPPYKGTLDFLPFFRALKASNYQGFVSVEVGLGYSTDPDAPAIRSKECYKELLENA